MNTLVYYIAQRSFVYKSANWKVMQLAHVKWRYTSILAVTGFYLTVKNDLNFTFRSEISAGNFPLKLSSETPTRHSRVLTIITQD